MITADRIDYLTHQFIWALENEAGWVNAARTAQKHNNFGQFRVITNPFIKRLYRPLEITSLNEHEYAYVVKTLWENMGGTFEVLMQNPGVLEPAYRDLERYRYTYATSEIKTHLDNAQDCLQRVEDNLNQTIQETKEETMSQIASAAAIPAFETRHFVFGNDITHLSEAQLIEAIKKVEAEIADLKTVKTKSKKLTAKITDLNEMLVKIVDVLDSK